MKLLSSFQEEFFSTKIPWILTDQRSLHLTDIFNWQTSSLHLSTNRMTYRSPTSSTFVLNTGFITLKIYGKYQKRIPRKKDRQRNSSWRFPKIICMIVEIKSPEIQITSFRSLKDYFIGAMSDRTINYQTNHWCPNNQGKILIWIIPIPK